MYISEGMAVVWVI